MANNEVWIATNSNHLSYIYSGTTHNLSAATSDSVPTFTLPTGGIAFSYVLGGARLYFRSQIGQYYYTSTGNSTTTEPDGSFFITLTSGLFPVRTLAVAYSGNVYYFNY